MNALASSHDGCLVDISPVKTFSVDKANPSDRIVSYSASKFFRSKPVSMNQSNKTALQRRAALVQEMGRQHNFESAKGASDCCRGSEHSSHSKKTRRAK